MKKYKTFIIVLVLIALGVLYYYYLSANDKTVSGKKKNEKSELEQLLEVNLETNYPGTPRDVVDFYSRFIVCCYAQKHDEEEIEKMAAQSLKLFDADLQEQNPMEKYTRNLKAEMEQYREEKRHITTYIIERSSDIEFKTFQGHYYAKVECIYYVKGEKATSRTMETYTLRKDPYGKWKILYWELTPLEDTQ